MTHLFGADSLTCLTQVSSYSVAVWPPDPHRQSVQRGQTTEGALHTERMKAFHWIVLYCAAPLLSDVQGTYHLMAGDPELMAAQSYAQTRNNGHPPLRTLNPASKSLIFSILVLHKSLAVVE